MFSFLVSLTEPINIKTASDRLVLIVHQSSQTDKKEDIIFSLSLCRIFEVRKEKKQKKIKFFS